MCTGASGVLSLPIRLRSLFAIHYELLMPALQIICRAINTLLIKRAGVLRKVAGTGAIMLIQRFGSAATLTGGLQQNDA